MLNANTAIFFLIVLVVLFDNIKGCLFDKRQPFVFYADAKCYAISVWYFTYLKIVTEPLNIGRLYPLLIT